jgi:hypothetical protein
MTDDLASFVASRQKYLKLEDQDEFQGYFIGYKIIADKFKISEDPKATTVLYAFRTKEDRPLEWTCGNVSVANKLVKAKPGQEIRIKRLGKGPKTVYDVVLVDAFYDGDIVPF